MFCCVTVDTSCLRTYYYIYFPHSLDRRMHIIAIAEIVFQCYVQCLCLCLCLRGGLRPALRPSINCGPMRNPDITKGYINQFQSELERMHKLHRIES